MFNNILNDTYTGGEHYWIRFHRGTHEVRKEGIEDNETVFRGPYEKCVSYLKQTIESNADYDLGL